MRLRSIGIGAFMLAIGASAVASLPPAASAADKTVLVVARDASDVRTFDPARAAETTPPLVLRAVYDTLVTVTPDDYTAVKPMAAVSWELADEGQSWVFHLQPGLKFASGNPLTADDVKFSFDRLKNLKDQPAYLADNLAEVSVVDPATVKVKMVDKSQPLLKFLASVSFAILDSKLVQEHGAQSGTDADKADQATQWLDNQSAGSGPYKMTGWQRNTAILLERNDNHQGEPAPFERVVIQYMGDSGAQLLALKNGDIDIAFNLTPEQLSSLDGDSSVTVASGLSLDFTYVTLTSSSELNPALAQPAARKAVAAAIDYEGIISNFLGGNALRPASFLAIGMAGSTEALTKEIGYRTDPAKAKALLAEAGYPDGFSFELSFPTTAFGGVPYDVLAQKIQSDLAQVGIKLTLEPMTTTNFTTKFKDAKSMAAMWEWVPDIPDPYTWTQPAVGRVAKRVHWTPPQELVDLMTESAGTTDGARAEELNRKFLTALAEQANYIVLFQPIYRVATSKAITGYRVTAAGWLTDLVDIKPAP